MSQLAAKREILTLQEAARYLRVKKEYLLQLSETGGVPARKIGGEWRYSREAIKDWLSCRPNPKAAILRQAGMFRGDEELPKILDSIYTRRGRPEIEAD